MKRQMRILTSKESRAVLLECMRRGLRGPPESKGAAPPEAAPSKDDKDNEQDFSFGSVRQQGPVPSWHWQPLPSGGWRSPIFMSAIPRMIFQGPPVSRRQQRKLGIARFVPGLGYGKRPCSRCCKHLWLGPNQLAQLEADPGIEIMCLTCIGPIFKAGLKDGTVAIADLGGRGPEYHMANGKYWGPPEETQN